MSVTTNFRQAAALALALTGVPAVCHANQTIVGTWSLDPTACTPVGGLISIGPLSLTADELQCEFRDVARTNDRVTWHGSCSDGASRTPTTVVAALRNGSLTIAMNGVSSGPYRRCRRE